MTVAAAPGRVVTANLARLAIVATIAIAGAVLGAAPAPARADATAPSVPQAPPAQAAPATPATKKDRAAQAKSVRHGPPPLPGTRPGKLVNLYNFWTKEWLAVEAGAPPPQATVDHFLRDHFTNRPTAMEPRLVGFMLAAAANFHGDQVHIVSGFRHPKYNLILRKKGHQVARDSQHTHGNAVDFFLPQVPAQALEAWARAQKLGGVGFYPDSGFVHMDTGPVRTWSGE